MEDASPLWGFVILGVLIFIHGILYGFGAAVQNLNKSNIERKAEEGDGKSQKLIHMIEEPQNFVNTLLSVITFMNMLVGAYEYQIVRVKLTPYFFQENSNWNSFLANAIVFLIPAVSLLFIIMLFGIIIPKKLGHRYAEQWAYGLLNIILFIKILIKPITALITFISNLIIRLFGINPKEIYDNVTEEEIMSMVNEGHEQGVLLASEAEMITNIFEFGDKQASDIMTHRKNIVAVDGMWSLKETIDFILTQNKSRFPVFDKDIDNIIGILHFKDAMTYYEQNDSSSSIKEISSLIRKVHFIPETRNINRLFKEMQSQKTHMVIVVDEYGQTAGLVAMEDILEEIVGNILDEYDEEEEMISVLEDGSYLIKGMADLEDVADTLEINFGEEEYDTLNGFLISKLDKIPQDGEELEIEYMGYRFMTVQVENKTIQIVKVIKLICEEEKIDAIENDK